MHIANMQMRLPSLALVAALLGFLASFGADAMALGGLPKVDPEFASIFDDTEVVKIKSPMSLAITPDGSKMFVTQKEGLLHLVEDFQTKSNPSSKPVLDLVDIMCSNGERALGGVAVHPKFGTENNWVYLYYTYNKFDDCDDAKDVNTGPVNRFSRWDFDERTGMIDPDSEKVFFDTPRLPAKLHNSGDIAFGKDGMVYVTVGDGGGRTDENDAGVVFPQALDRLLGKVIRLTDDGEIPSDNPYANDDDAVVCGKNGLAPKATMKCKEIYSRGHRNPIRFAFNPNTPDGVTEYYINEVGRAVWEEINKGGTGYAGANYGYPRRTGKCIEDSETKCTPPTEEEEYTDPVHWYHHDEEHGGCVTAGAFVPNDAGWPAAFQDAYIYADYAIGGFYVMTPDGEGCEWPKCKVPVSPFAETIKVLSAHEAVIYMKFGPSGVDKKTGQSKQALYYVSRDGDMRGVHKIEFTGTANRGPKAEIYADPTFGFKPLQVNFDGTGSIDPDGDELTYEWDVDGDGVVDSTSSKTIFEYNEAGTHYATLTVRDGKGGKAQTEIRIEVENTPPTPVILTPAEGTTFYVDQEFELIGTATDGEEGQLDDSHLTWEVRQHHNTHYHPWVDPETPGNNLIIKAPEPEDFDASLTSYLEILLTATDSQGLSTTVSRKIFPRKVEVLIDSVPRGLEVIAYGDVHVTPKKVITWDNHIFEVKAYDQTIDGSTYTFDSWNDGGEQTHGFEALPVGNDEVREDGIASKNVIIARFSKDGIPVKDDSTATELPSDEADVDTMVPPELDEDKDEGELAALEKDEGIADLSDFVVAIRLNGNDSTVRRRHLSEAELISYLDDNLKSFTAQTLKKELKAIAESSENISYAKPNRVRLTLKGRTFREGKNYKAVFGGIVSFKRKQENQQLPSEAAVQSMQLQAMDELSNTIFYDIKSNVPEARVATVVTSSDVPAKLYNIALPTEPSGSIVSSSDGSVKSSSDSIGSNTIIILSCSIVGGLALIAISAFLIIRGRQRPRQSDKASAIAAGTDDDALDSLKKKGEATSLVGKKEEDSTDDEEAQDFINNTMATDNESLPASPSRGGAPVGDNDSALEDGDGSVVALAPNPIMKHTQQVEDEKPEAASDDEASTARGSVEQGPSAEASEAAAPLEGNGDDEASTASKSVAASSLHVGEMEQTEEGTGTLDGEPTAASDDEASTASTRFGAVEEE